MSEKCHEFVGNILRSLYELWQPHPGAVTLGAKTFPRKFVVCVLVCQSALALKVVLVGVGGKRCHVNSPDGHGFSRKFTREEVLTFSIAFSTNLNHVHAEHEGCASMPMM